MIVITEENFEELVIKSTVPVILDFSAPWCGPCKTIVPYLENIETEFEGKAIVGKINIDENNNIAIKYGIRNIPTVIFIKNGEQKEKLVGVFPKDKYKEVLNSLL